MSIQFKAEKSLNVSGIKMITIKTNDDEPVFVKTEKCFSFGVRRDTKFGTVSMSLVLDEDSLKTLKNIVKECEAHLGRPLTKKLKGNGGTEQVGNHVFDAQTIEMSEITC